MNLRIFRKDAKQSEARTPETELDQVESFQAVSEQVQERFEQDMPAEDIPEEYVPSEAAPAEEVPAKDIPAENIPSETLETAKKLKKDGFWKKPAFLSWTASGDRYFELPESEKPLPDMLTSARLILAVVLIVVTVFVKGISNPVILGIRIAAAVIAGYDLAITFVNELRRKSLIFETLPILLTVILAFCNNMSLEAAIACVVFRLSLCLRSYVFCQSERHLMTEASLPVAKNPLQVGDSFMAEAGMTIPADCIIAQGSLTTDLSFVQGERSERSLKQGDSLPAGSVCLGGSALVEIVGLPEDTVSYAVSEKMRSGYRVPTSIEKKAEQYAMFLTPALLVFSVILLIVLPLTTELRTAEVLRRIISILSIASPCGVLVSIPIAHLASMSLMRRSGIAFKTANAVDAASRAGIVVFDKTGTITAERYAVSSISTDKMDPTTFLRAAAHAASISENPMAKAIVDACGEPLTPSLISDGKESQGWGVSVTVGNIPILLGTPYFMDKNGVEVSPLIGDETRVYMAVSGIPAGFIALADSIDPQSRSAVQALADAGIDRVAMVSEDSRERDRAAAAEAGIAEYYAECSDDDKLKHISELKGKAGPNRTVALVSARGHGSKAAPAADLHVVLDCAAPPMEEGDILILSDSLNQVAEAVSTPKRGRRNIIVSLFSALGFKLVVAALAATGILPLWFCVTIDACAMQGLILAESYFNTRIK